MFLANSHDYEPLVTFRYLVYLKHKLHFVIVPAVVIVIVANDIDITKLIIFPNYQNWELYLKLYLKKKKRLLQFKNSILYSFSMKNFLKNASYSRKILKIL